MNFRAIRAEEIVIANTCDNLPLNIKEATMVMVTVRDKDGKSKEHIFKDGIVSIEGKSKLCKGDVIRYIAVK